MSPSSKLDKKASKNLSTREEKTTINDINPEVAAQVVRDYLLPMFSTKRRSKNAVVTNLKSSASKVLKSDSKSKPKIEERETVFGELVLSDIIYSKLEVEKGMLLCV